MTYDVTVVGAGPAGSTTAKLLSEKGFKTLLIDKEQFPRDKPCGGGLPLRVLQRFPYVVDDKIIEAYSSSGTVFSPSLKHQIDICKDRPIISTILRKKFDYELLNFAQNAGAIIQQQTLVDSVKTSDEKAQVKLHQGQTIDTEIVVGADGVNSVIAKTTGLQKTGAEKGVCLLQEFEVDENIMDEYFTPFRHCYIHSRFKSIGGYGWVFPKKKHLNVGFGIVQALKNLEQKPNILKCYQSYVSLLKESNLIPQDLKKAEIKGGALPTHPLEKTYGRRLLLVGDAAGFINPLSGEGIYYAMASGKIAAELITEALEKNDTTEEFLSKYQRLWQKDFGKDIDRILTVVKRGSVEYTERVIHIVSKDRKLTDLMMGVITGELGVEEYKWRILRRFVYSSFKHRLGL